MPATNVFDTNLAVKYYSWQGSPLALGSATFSNAEVRTLTQLKLPVPCKGLVYAKLTSGALTYKVSVNSGTANFGSPQVNRTISDTAEYANEFAVTAANRFVDTQLTAGGAGCVINRGNYRFEAKFPAGHSYHEAVRGWNAFDATGGDFSTDLT